MRKSKFQRLTAFTLALLMILSVGVIGVGAAKAEKNESVSGTTTSDIRTLLNAISYNDYDQNHAEVPLATTEVVFHAVDHLNTDVTEEGVRMTDADYEVVSRGGKDNVLLIPGTGKVSWTIRADDPQMAVLKNIAKYNVVVNYYPEEGKAASIERIFMINGSIPFAESRYMTLPKLWNNVYPNAKMEVTEKMDAQALLAEAQAAGVEACGMFSPTVD